MEVWFTDAASVPPIRQSIVVRQQRQSVIASGEASMCRAVWETVFSLLPQILKPEKKLCFLEQAARLMH